MLARECNCKMHGFHGKKDELSHGKKDEFLALEDARFAQQ
jgi:hypothetical protein